MATRAEDEAGPGEEARSPKGYHQLAIVMSKSDRLAIFRRFNNLNMLSLLSLQAEILDLQDEFRDICSDDDNADLPFSTCFQKLLASKNHQNNFQYQKLKDIREKMAEYNAMLLQVGELSKSESPSKRDLGILRDWLKHPHGGNSTISGPEARLWEETDGTGENTEHDLVAVGVSRGEEDLFTRWLLVPLTELYHRVLGARRESGFRIDEETGLVEYPQEKLESLGLVISVTVSSVLPVIAILALYFERDLLKRIYIMIGMTAAFAILLCIFSSARRIEIFGATTAFAAVEVVFIGSTSTYFGSPS